MGAPSVSYEMMPEGFEIASDDNGLRAQVAFRTLWADAYTFHDEALGFASTPWQFPGAPAARLYAKAARITPLALDESGRPLPLGTTMGMSPGEYWKWARIEVTFETPPFAHVSGDDPGNATQLDPANPIYDCEQSVRIGTRAEPIGDLTKITFDSAPTKSPSEATIYRADSHLTLHYPFTAGANWQKYQDFADGAVNDAAFLDCAAGTLLFMGADIQPTKGSQGRLGRSITIDLSYDPSGWNKLPFPGTGVPSLVRYKDNTSKRLYEAKDFGDLLL